MSNNKHSAKMVCQGKRTRIVEKANTNFINMFINIRNKYKKLNLQ